jgi:hypothetical protein
VRGCKGAREGREGEGRMCGGSEKGKGRHEREGGECGSEGGDA